MLTRPDRGPAATAIATVRGRGRGSRPPQHPADVGQPRSWSLPASVDRHRWRLIITLLLWPNFPALHVGSPATAAVHPVSSHPALCSDTSPGSRPVASFYSRVACRLPPSRPGLGYSVRGVVAACEITLMSFAHGSTASGASPYLTSQLSLLGRHRITLLRAYL